MFENKKKMLLLVAKLIEKTTHMWRRWGVAQNFLLAILKNLKNPKNQNFEKMKKNCCRCH